MASISPGRISGVRRNPSSDLIQESTEKVRPASLEHVGADYIRVSVIALASLGLAVFLGYYLATHHRVGDAVLPAIQIFAAFPAPTYFPLVFIATLPLPWTTVLRRESASARDS